MKCSKGHSVGSEAKFCPTCGETMADAVAAFQGGMVAQLRARKWPIPAAILAVIVIISGSIMLTSSSAKAFTVVDQISGQSCAEVANSLHAHRGSIVVVQGPNHSLVGIGKVAAVWESQTNSGTSCDLELKASVPLGLKQYRVVVGSATPLILTSTFVATAVTTAAWVAWDGSTYTQIS